jgi:hypothetical protein
LVSETCPSVGFDAIRPISQRRPPSPKAFACGCDRQTLSGDVLQCVIDAAGFQVLGVRQQIAGAQRCFAIPACGHGFQFFTKGDGQGPQSIRRLRTLREGFAAQLLQPGQSSSQWAGGRLNR